MKRNLFAFAVVGMVLMTNINSAYAADNCTTEGGSCFDSDSQTCSVAPQTNKCTGPNSIVCCPKGSTVKTKPGVGVPRYEIKAAIYGAKENDSGDFMIAWDRNLTEDPIKVKFTTVPIGLQVIVAEGGMDPAVVGILVDDGQAYRIDRDGEHGQFRACVPTGGSYSAVVELGTINVVREKTPNKDDLVAPKMLAHRVVYQAALQTPASTATQLQAAATDHSSQLDRIEGGVNEVRHGTGTKIGRLASTTGGGAAVGLGVGAALGGSVLGGMAVGGPVGAGVGLVVGLVWWVAD